MNKKTLRKVEKGLYFLKKIEIMKEDVINVIIVNFVIYSAAKFIENGKHGDDTITRKEEGRKTCFGS